MLISWRDLIVNVVVGTVAGGITNWVAVLMLFHPYERRFGIQGAIPKNKSRLARSIGRTVGEKLLTPADVLAELDRSGLRTAIEQKLAILFESMLERERGSLRQELPPALLVEIERGIESIGGGLAEGYANYVSTPEFETAVRKFVANARTQVSGIPLARVLTPERRASLAQQAAILSTDLIESARQDQGRSARAKIGDFLLQLAGTERTEKFVERAVGEALERAEGRTVGDIIGALTDETYVEWILNAARSPRAAELAMRSAGGAARNLLDRPIGRPAQWLPAETSHRIAAVASAALWEWAVAQLPSFIERLDIEGMVERKVLGFSTARIEELIRNVTERELRLIVHLGYFLGAVIGLVTYLLQRILLQ